MAGRQSYKDDEIKRLQAENERLQAENGLLQYLVFIQRENLKDITRAINRKY